MERMPFVRHPWYPQSAYMFRRARLHAPTRDAMGDDSGYTYGTFTSKTPYAFVPKHTGLDGYYGYGADAADPCGVNEIQALVVNKITSGLPTSLSLKVAGFEVAKVDVASTVRSAILAQLTALQPAAWAALDSAASAGVSAIRTALTTHVTPVITNALKPVAGNYAYLLGSVIDNAMASVYTAIAAEIQKCKGPAAVDLTAPQVDPNVCTNAGMYALDTGIVLPSGAKLYGCTSTPPQQMIDVEMVAPQQSATITELNKHRPTGSGALIQSFAQWDAQCKAAGGAISVQADGSHLCYDPYVGAAPAGTTPAATAAAGGGGVAVLAGAAILAFLLLR